MFFSLLENLECVEIGIFVMHMYVEMTCMYYVYVYMTCTCHHELEHPDFSWRTYERLPGYFNEKHAF